MGCCVVVEQPKEDKRIGEELHTEKRIDHSVKKLLLLGSSGSGKSTLFKNLRKSHGKGYDDKDRLGIKAHIIAQILDQMRFALECIEILKEEEFDQEFEVIKLEKENINNKHEKKDQGAVKKESDEVMISYNDLELSDAGQLAADTLQRAMKWKKTRNQVTMEIADVITILWAERAIKYVFALRSTMRIDDSCQYFWEQVYRIATPDYVPNDYDILLAKYRTTGGREQKFEIKGNVYDIYDLGGARGERKKWIHYFEHVTAVLFCASLSCYNEVMFEDEEANSMVDQLQLFEEIVNDEWFNETAIILFLTKPDLFAEKIQRIPITNCHALRQYAGISDSNDDAVEYIREVFVSKSKERHKHYQVFSHVLDCTDANNVEAVFNDLQTVIINASLARACLIA